jgi:hypothetical protein
MVSLSQRDGAHIMRVVEELTHPFVLGELLFNFTSPDTVQI